MPKGVIRQQLRQPLGQRLGISRRNQEAGPAVLDLFGNAADRCRHHWCTAREGLEHGVREGVCACRMGVDVGRLVTTGNRSGIGLLREEAQFSRPDMLVGRSVGFANRQQDERLTG